MSEQVNKIDPSKYFESKSEAAVHDLIASAVSTGAKMVQAGAVLTQVQIHAGLGLAKYFTGMFSNNDTINQQEHVMDKYFDHMKEAVNNVADSQNFYLENHPRRGFLASAPSWTGEQVAMLPLYEAINPATELAGKGAVAVSEKIAPKLTKTLLKSKIGQFVGRRLMDATTGFLAGKGLGESNAQSGEDAASFAVGGGLIEGGAKAVGAPIKYAAEMLQKDLHASDFQIKEHTANLLAMGGRPFVEAVHAQADLEEGQDRVLRSAEENNIPPETKGKVVASRAARETNDPTTHTLVKAERYTLNSLAQRHYGASYGDLSRGKRQIIKDRRIELMHEAEYEMPALVPDLNKMEVQSDHEKQVAESPAYAALSHQLDQLFPEQSQGGISEVNQQQVEANQIMTGIKDNTKKAAEVQNVRGEQLYAHIPSYQEAEGDSNVEQIKKEGLKRSVNNPVLARTVEDADSVQGVNRPGQPVIIFSAIPERTIGIDQSFGSKVDKENILGVVYPKKGQTIKQAISESGIAKNRKMTSERFASHRVDTIAYFKNPSSAPRGKYANARAADGTLIGGRSKLSWNERMKRENFDQFIDTLKDADGDRIHFENPYHRMLFHWANRDSLPTPVRDKLLREMKGYLARQKNPVYASAKEISDQADWNLVHLTKLAQSGRLTSEGNVFRSTNVNGQGTMTQWQGELDTELEKQEYETLRKSLTLYPEQKELLENAMHTLANARAVSKTPKEWLEYNAAINQHLKLGGIH